VTGCVLRYIDLRFLSGRPRCCFFWEGTVKWGKVGRVAAWSASKRSLPVASLSHFAPLLGIVWNLRPSCFTPFLFAYCLYVKGNFVRPKLLRVGYGHQEALFRQARLCEVASKSLPHRIWTFFILCSYGFNQKETGNWPRYPKNIPFREVVFDKIPWYILWRGY